MQVVALLGAVLALALAPALAVSPAGDAGSAQAAEDYRLPYGGGLRLLTLQGQNQGSHVGQYNRYAYDFAAGPRDNTPFVVTAARAGVVAREAHGYDPGADCDPGAVNRANYVLIDHGDRTGATYSHLLKDSVLVRPGQRVTQGQPLGRSGRTGYVCGVAHLHFTVVQLPSMTGLDRPFSDPSLNAIGGRPRTNGWYESSNAPLSAANSTAAPRPIYLPLLFRQRAP